MSPLHDPDVTLDVDDNRLSDRGYIRRWYPQNDIMWRSAEKDGLFRWPGTNLITLKPEYPESPSEAQKSQWTLSDSGTWREVQDTNFCSGAAIFQQAPDAEDLTLESDFTASVNQPFIVDFYLYSFTNTSAWYWRLVFGDRYRFELLYDGTLYLQRDMAVGDTETRDWKSVLEMPLLDRAQGHPFRLWVYPTNRHSLLIMPMTAEPTSYIEIDAERTDEDDGNTVYATTLESAFEAEVAHGSFYFSLRYPDFATSGNIKLDEQFLPKEHDGTFTLDYGHSKPRTGLTYTIEQEIQDSEGAEIASPPEDAFDSFYPYLSISGGSGDASPEIYWMEMHIAPSTEVVTGSNVSIAAGGRLQEAAVSRDMDADTQANITLWDSDDAVGAYGLEDTLDMLATIAEDGTQIWQGYLRNLTQEEHLDADRTVYRGSDMLRRLEVPLSDAYVGDGKVHTAWVEEIFQRCGLAASDYDIATDADSYTLPEDVTRSRPIFQARDGRTAREMLEYLCRVWTGWELLTSKDGTVLYQPQPDPSEDLVAWYLTGAEYTGGPNTAPDHMDASAAYLKYYQVDHQRDERLFANNIVVIGRNLAGEPVVAQKYNSDSITDNTADDYLGYERLLMVVDTNLRTVEQCEQALDYIVAYHGEPLYEADVTGEIQAGIDTGDLVVLEDYSDYVYQVRHVEYRYPADRPECSLRVRRVAETSEWSS